MDLHSSNPFWLLNDGIPANYPSLRDNIITEVAVIGAGITGALVAHHLFDAGIKVCVFDKRHVGTGSTAASTSLLQYEIDTPLHKLSEMIGEKNAIGAYRLCLGSIDDLKKICDELTTSVDLEFKKSFQYASYKKHVGDLKKEYTMRRKNGIVIHYLDEDDIKKKWGFYAPAGIISDKGAQIDAYKLTHQLLISDVKKGLNVFDNTEIINIEHKKRSVQLTTKSGKIITARYVVIACGYESQHYLPKKVESLQSTFAIASEPLATDKIWYHNSLIWETASPYLYLRTTKDKRIIIGGKDEIFLNAVKRDSKIHAKTKLLEKSFAKLFPTILFKTDFQWAGTFATTKDGLPYIGSIMKRPHTFFALGFGGNGITYSVIAAQAITQKILGKNHIALKLFSFDR
ncbi:MAG TPA: FAD-dependent oxidoreductase [Puia sp.]|nr:FAD-dependent oxidoreductase [Puia sp.]